MFFKGSPKSSIAANGTLFGTGYAYADDDDDANDSEHMADMTMHVGLEKDDGNPYQMTCECMTLFTCCYSLSMLTTRPVLFFYIC